MQYDVGWWKSGGKQDIQWADFQKKSYKCLMELLIPCHDTLSGVLKKRQLSEPRTPRFCIDCNLRWHECRSWEQKSPLPYIRSSSVGQPSYHSCVSSGTPSKASVKQSTQSTTSWPSRGDAQRVWKALGHVQIGHVNKAEEF